MSSGKRVAALHAVMLLLASGGAAGMGYCFAVFRIQERIPPLFVFFVFINVIGNFALGRRLRWASAKEESGDVRK